MRHRVLWGVMAFAAVTAAVLSVVRVPVAAAAPSVTCTGTNAGANGVLDVAVSGTSANTDSLTISASGGDYSVVLNSGGPTAVCTAATFPDSGASGFPTVEVTGSTLVATDFQASGDDGLTFEGQAGIANTLDLGSLPGSGVTVSVTAGTVSWGGGQNSFSGISIFDGSSSGGTTFEAGGAGGYTFSGGGSTGNVLDLSAAPAGPRVSIPSGSVSNLATGTDTFSDVQTFNGSAAGGTWFTAGAVDGQTFNSAGNGNIFIAGSGSDTFNGSGNGDRLDFGLVSTAKAAPLQINLSGSSIGSTANNTATVGPTTYSFSGIKVFLGAQSGNTQFIPSGTTGGYTIEFEGSGVPGSGDTLDLSRWSPYAGGTIVSVPDGYARQGSTLVDFFVGSPAKIDGPASGNTTFLTGTTSGFTFNGSGTGNVLGLMAAGPGITASIPDGTLTLGSGSDDFSGISSFVGSNAGGTDFIASGTSGGYTFDAGSGSGDTLDLAAMPASGTVSIPAGTVSWETSQDTFSGVSSFVGSGSGGTTFFTGSTGGFTFTGGGASGNVLDLSGAGPGVSVSVPNGKISGLSGADDDFSGIQGFNGSSLGGTTFTGGSGDGEIFAGAGNGNLFIAGSGSATFIGGGGTGTLDLSAVATSQASPLTVNLSGAAVGDIANDTATVGPTTYSFSAITTFTGPQSGNTTFLAGSSGGFTFNGQGSGNALDLNAAPGATVTVNGDSLADPGTVSGLTADDDTFSDIQSFPGQATVLYRLSVTSLGAGVGSVTSAPTGIDCGSTCSHNFASGTNVMLTETPAAGSTFAGWSGACTGTGVCTVPITSTAAVSATFEAQTSYTLSVAKSGNGTGTVTTSPSGIDCGSTCSHSFVSGTDVTLTATPAAGSTFAGWSGACTGSGACSVPMSAAKSVSAAFSLVPAYALIVTKSGKGKGTVTSSPAGIDCGATCSYSFTGGTGVTLNAVATAGSTFAGWHGACEGDQPCSLTITAADSVTALFLPDCVVPNVKHKSLATARRTLKVRSCAAGRIKQAYSKNVKKGRIISEKPKAGRDLQPGATVNLLVSKGRHRRRK